MKIGITSDHAGYDLKETIKKYLSEKGYEIVDFGPENANSVDYPDFAKKLTKSVVSEEVKYGIGICGTGIGMNIACNKARGIRAALCSDPLSASLTRQHNNANILNLGARIIGDELAKNIVYNFLNSEFEGGRHQNRINKIED